MGWFKRTQKEPQVEVCTECGDVSADEGTIYEESKITKKPCKSCVAGATSWSAKRGYDNSRGKISR